MSKIVGVEFKTGGKIFYLNTKNINVEKNQDVIAETEKGLQLGKVVTEAKEISDNSLDNNYFDIIRIANKDDIIVYENNKNEAVKAMQKAQKIANDLNLSMKFVEANFTFDKNQLLFYFLADNRVDFRELAKQLASVYKTRIELRQIGVRDKAKEVSGMGQCGRKLCCASFLNDLDSVSINMAKNQNLALNPTKINGVCGRLLCCLKYEDDLYLENRTDMPELGQNVDTEEGKGEVIFLDIPNKKYIVNVKDYGKLEIKLPSKCESCGKCNK